MTRYAQSPATKLHSRPASSRQAALARQARDDGLRRVRKLTFRVGVVAAAAAAFMGAKFAHLSAPSIHLPSGFSGNSSGNGGSFSGNSSSSGSSSSSGISSSSGVSSSSGGGVSTSGGS